MILEDINASILRFCADFADAHTNMTVINFDANADEASLPLNDVIGISGVTVAADESQCEVTMLFGVSTRDDTNLFRLNRCIAELFEMLLPEQRIRLYDANTGQAKGYLVAANGTRTLAIGGSATRPLQYVMVQLLSTSTFQT